MKFKIEKKDLVIFIVYSIVVLYLCALLVVNFFNIINEGEFYGFVKPQDITGNYLALTFTLYAALLIIIFSSVSSYIFNKEKGYGISLEIGKKSPDGYSRWAKEKEIIEQKGIEKVQPYQKDIKAAGVPIISNDKGIHVDNGEYHNLVIGSTGSGKTETLVKPMVNLLARKGESMVITDPKGEIYKYTAENLKSKGYKVILLNFREPQKGNSWNPLSLPYQYYKEGLRDKSNELLNDVALNILYEKGGSNDPFWERTAADYFAGLASGLFIDATEEEVNLNSINYMSTVGEEKYGVNGTYIKEYFTLKGEDSKPYIFASATISAPNETKGSILSTFRQKIRIFSTTENLSEMLSFSDFDMRNIGKEKTAVFLVIHDEKKTYHSLMTIFIKQCYETLIDVAQDNGGKLNYRTNFILDEFANMPPLKDVDAMISAARSRDIRFTFIIQNFAQLTEVYGEHIGEVIKGNCGNLIYLISTELKALEEISKMCGEVKSKENDKTSSTPLITVSDLQKLKLFQAVIIRLRTNPFKTQLKPNFKIDWGEEYPKADFPTRSYKEIAMFDVKKHVQEEKRKRQMESGMGSNNMNPFAPSFSGMPNMPGMPTPPSGFNPFDMSNIFKNPHGLDEEPNEPVMPSTPFSDIDVDALMKDIDEKLKKLDEEEKIEKERLAKLNSEKEIEELAPTPEVKIKTLDEITPKENPVQKEQGTLFTMDYIDNVQKNEKQVDNPKINVDTSSKIVNQSHISDDAFYDDFFE